MWKLMLLPESHWDREVDQNAVKSVMANAIIKSHILLEASAGSTPAINNPLDNKNKHKMTTQD